jgi:L-alanine-DL-glutamate epimerase-like enolase superfamily enzyme
MKIKCVELYHVSIPLNETFYPSWIPGFPQKENRFTLIHLITDDGIEGWSAGPAMAREREGLGHLVGPYFIDLDPADIDLIQQRLREMSYLGWRNWWIEPACWDILGKAKAKPVYELLGGKGGEVTLYASNGEVFSPERSVAEAQKRLDMGFKGIKLRVHDFDESKDIAQVEAVAKAFAGRLKIGVDANQGWRVTVVDDAPLWDLARAKRFSDKCAEFGISWIEEPLPMDEYSAIAELTKYSSVPIAGAELHSQGYPELKMMIERGCYHIYQPDATFCGGIAQTKKVLDLCVQHNLKFTPHTWTNGIGFAINLQIFAANPHRDEMMLEFPYNPPSWIPEARDGILEEPFLPNKEGKMKIPDKPGLGFEINRKSLKKYGKRFFKMTPARLVYYVIRDKGLRTAIELGKKKRRRISEKG